MVVAMMEVAVLAVTVVGMTEVLVVPRDAINMTVPLMSVLRIARGVLSRQHADLSLSIRYV